MRDTIICDYKLPSLQAFMQRKIPLFFILRGELWLSLSTWTQTTGLKHLVSQGKLGMTLLEATTLLEAAVP